MLKPFSYDVPVSSFGQVEEMWDADGKMLAKLSDRPINLGVQDDTQPPADPPAAAAAAAARISRQARHGLAARRPGPDLPRAGAGAGRRRALAGADGAGQAPFDRLRAGGGGG